jgi:hypothetical protein
MFWGNKFASAMPKNADFEEQQKHNCNHQVTLGVSKNTGKYAVFLPSLLEARMRGPPVEGPIGEIIGQRIVISTTG